MGTDKSLHKMLIIGGDLRSLYLHEILEKEGAKVKITGFSDYKNEKRPTIQNITVLKKALANVEAVIGPIPCCSFGTNLNTPFNTTYIQVQDLFDLMVPEQLFFAGRISGAVAAMAAERHIRAYDLLKREEMAVLNAIPTAEGALQLAIENMKTTLHESNALVMGFGRVGKALTRVLQGVGAHVFIAVRKYADAALARSQGYRPIFYDALPEYLGRMGVIFNTVPAIVLDKTNMRYIPEDCVLIELASKPFGIDTEESRKKGLSIIWAPSLPGKIAPATAARYIKDTIINITESGGDDEITRFDNRVRPDGVVLYN